jgi:hypothetical protein
MPHQEIPSAFVIRALARRPAEHCDRCNHRMFVKGPSGLCPFCRADRPVRALESASIAVSAREPFAPYLDEQAVWRRVSIRSRLHDLAARSRAGAKPLQTTS